LKKNGRDPAGGVATLQGVLSYNRTLLFGAIAVIALSVILTADPNGVYIFGWQLPESCVFKRQWDMDCLGCGLTRSFVYMGHLDPRGAFERHLIGPLLWAATAFQIPYRAWRLYRRAPQKGPK